MNQWNQNSGVHCLQVLLWPAKGVFCGQVSVGKISPVSKHYWGHVCVHWLETSWVGWVTRTGQELKRELLSHCDLVPVAVCGPQEPPTGELWHDVYEPQFWNPQGQVLATFLSCENGEQVAVQWVRLSLTASTQQLTPPLWSWLTLCWLSYNFWSLQLPLEMSTLLHEKAEAQIIQVTCEPVVGPGCRPRLNPHMEWPS